MHTKRHRQNHDFTILYNLVGSCHTADQAYALLQICAKIARWL